MRRGIGAGALLLALAGCGPDWQPSWNMASQPTVTGDSLTIRRVTGEDPEFTPLRSESVEQLRLSAGALQSTRPTSPEAAMTSVPDYNPVPRPNIDAQTAPPARRAGSSSPPPAAAPAPQPPQQVMPRQPAQPPEPPEREGARVIPSPGPGQPPAVVTGGSGRVQGIVQPGNPAGGVAIQDGGTTTIIQPGGRVTTVPTPR